MDQTLLTSPNFHWCRTCQMSNFESIVALYGNKKKKSSLPTHIEWFFMAEYPMA